MPHYKTKARVVALTRARRLERGMMIAGASLLVIGALSLRAKADDGMSGFTLSANAAIASDYRFRGISLTDRDPAIQGGFDVNHDSGFYVGTWGSSIESYAGSEVEMDIYAGYTSEIGGLSTDVGLLAYTYPGSSDTYYLEVYGSVGATAGMVNWTLGGAYVWDQANVGSTDNIYLYLNADMPLGDTAFSLAGHMAYEDGAFGNDKWDWNVGVSYAFKQYSLSLMYVDTNVNTHNGDGGVVAMLSASF